MTLLGRFAKGASKAAEQAKFEADKLRRVNRLTAEANGLANEVKEATAAIGVRMMELRAAGKVQLPELDEMVRRVEELQAKLEVKQAELEKAKAEKYTDIAVQQEPVTDAEGVSGVDSAPAERASRAQFCPGCGTPIKDDSSFCPACGRRLD